MTRSVMPIAAPLYPPPPYEFRRARQTWVVYEADPASIARLLPDGVAVDSGDGDVAVCAAWACHYPVSTFGPYLEAYVVVRVVVGDERFWYQPVIVTDAEAPMAAGREVWGYGKKLAHLTWSGQDAGGPGTEQLVMTVDRPAGVRLMALSMAPDRLIDGPELMDLETAELLPTLSHRVLPGLVDELVAVDVRPKAHRGADGRLELWRGRGHVELNGTAADPWHAFRPSRVLDAFSACTDFVLPEGRVVPRAPTDSTTEE
ncbi:acetoacetate decarboxylase family protein [Nocardioides sp.]|uniref:acetoacetate decarboxylase family protein n=1 Tax=Nocardioides sp. TaxID=35761 RepID=UPI00260933A8|nr:acetoacetate decarboxylase family protein [Nocardioides sp.]MDI6910594.1 acetoacetate decarboxylase family protein [Nocardioides sp.]